MPELKSLPAPTTHAGEIRKVGVEVELGGLDEDRVAAILAAQLGGTIKRTAEYERRVEGSAIGDIDVLLDTALRDRVAGQITRMGLDLGRAVIPVEFVTDPVAPEQISLVDRACRALSLAGGTGTQSGLLLGFGLHLNVALPGTQVDDILPTLTAFALIEDWMRDKMHLDAARRVQPFVDTYPSELVDRLCDPSGNWTIQRLVSTYLSLAPDRNHALDALPILKHLNAAAVVAAVPQMSHKSGRPAWHYRLPDCRLDDPTWSVALEWNRWCVVEEVAQNEDLVERLKTAWHAYRSRALPIPGRWYAVSGEVLEREVRLP
ncbi:amidoligase family protein [Palleronia sp.]|uniref:amidoligase family protein n=1 Tax=Palleronia sp. TaxID=1940284 RepID=UPI0035C7FC30